MKGITTIASLPSGAGQAAHLPDEVGEARKPEAEIARGGFLKPYVHGGFVGAPIGASLGKPAFTPFSQVTAIAPSVPVKPSEFTRIDLSDLTCTVQSEPVPENLARLGVIGIVGPLQYELNELVYWNNLTTAIILARGLAKMPGAPATNIDSTLRAHGTVVTTDGAIAQQLADAGYRLMPFDDISIGIGWSVQKNENCCKAMNFGGFPAFDADMLDTSE